MHPNNFTITGRITDIQSGQGLPGLRIEAWDKDLFFDDLVGSAETDAEGTFEIRFNEKHFRELIERKPDLYFKLYGGDEAIPGEDFELTVTSPSGEPVSGSGDSIYWQLEPGQTDVSISLSLLSANPVFRVEGAITQPDGSPVAGVTVRAVDKDLRHEEELGEAITNQAGEYKITYGPQQFYRAEKKTADLIVRIFDAQDQLLAASAVLFNAPAAVTINLTVNAGLSEFERITEALGSLLKIDNVSLSDLNEEDVTFLAGETGFSAQWLQILADAARIAVEVDPGLPEADKTAIFYGLGRKAQPMVLDQLLTKDFFVLRKVLENALHENILPRYLSASLDAIFELLALLADQSAVEKPGHHIDVQQKRLRSIGDFLGLDTAKINTLINQAVTFSGVNDTTLGSLVEAGDLEEQEARAVGLAVSLYHLLDANTHLAEALMTTSYPLLPQGNLNRIKDLVVFDTSDWAGILSQAGITPPNNLTIDEYAAVLVKKIELLYPSDALMARLIMTDDETTRTDLETLQPLFDKNEIIVGIDKFDHFDTKGVQADEIEKLRNSHARLLAYANSYKALKLNEIIDNREMSADDKAMQIAGRIELLAQFHSQNPDKEILTLDYSPDSADIEALDFDGFSDEEQQMLLGCLKSYQRVYSLSKDIRQSRTMMAAGYDSAWAITNGSQQDYQSSTGMSHANAERGYQSAVASVETTTQQFGTILGLVHERYDQNRTFNQSPNIEEYLKKIDGFAELFGSQDYCKCQHCQSILSPAAYFVDLMSFVEDKVLSSSFSDDNEDHVLHLKTRRADLWTLPLTCDNTHDLTAYLDIINEILENYIYITGQGTAIDELPERDDIEAFVYRNVINESVRSFQQPVLLPLEKLEAYLSHFDLTRGEIARLLEIGPDSVAAAALSLSGHEYQLVTQPKTDPGFLKNLYGIDFEIDLETGSVTKFDAQTLLSPMRLTRSELGDLIGTQFIESSSPDDIQIIGGMLNPEDDVQNNVENIHGLTTTSLDYMHRFIRLWRQLSWTISELDLVIAQFQDVAPGTGNESDSLLYLAALLDIQRRFDVSVEELCTLWSNIPQRGLADNSESQFDRLFNLPDFVLMDGRYPKSDTRFIHPAFSEGDQTGNRDLHRLLAGLGVDDEQLFQLIVHLSDPFGLDLDPDSTDYQPGFVLSVDNLSLLYRHARMAQKFKLKIPQLFQLIDQSQAGVQDYLNNFNDLSALLQYYDWWISSDYSLDDISLILTNETPAGEAFSDAGEIAQRLVETIGKEGALSFADTVFAYLEGITEEQSKVIIETNSGWISGVPDSPLNWLSNSFDPAMLKDSVPTGLTFSTAIFSMLKGISPEQSLSIIDENPGLIEKLEIQNPGGRTQTVGRITDHFKPDSSLVMPPDISVTMHSARALLIAYYEVSNADTRSLLMAYHASEVVPSYLAGEFGAAADKTSALIGLAGVELASSDFILALQSTGPAAEEILILVKKLSPLNILFGNKRFTTDSLEFITHNRDQSEVFENIDFNELTIADIQKISVYAGFIPATENQKYLPDLHDVLLAFDPAHKYANADDAKLARVLDSEPGLALTVVAQESLPSTALAALDKLRRCVETAKYLGVGGEALALLLAEDYKELSEASDTVLGAFRAKYSDEETWQLKVAPYKDRIAAIKRDALTDFLIHSDDHEWCESYNDIYYYFLIDVELEGCALTSRVVAAISSLQLYVHRVLMNLEQSSDGDIQVKPDDPEGFRKEWEWRKNYRVWEANRKVFLFPENWIEPELRDNKTPLFEALESELLQQEINEQTVLDAYANYMSGFEEVSHLKIAGACSEQDKISGKDILHLFGVTADEPPIYYYRGIENVHASDAEISRGIVWSPWRKIEVQIPVAKVSPIIFRGRLHVFWIEITTRPKNEVKDGSSEFAGYQHKMSLKYTSLRLDGSWTTAQRISLYGVHPFDDGDGVIDDPLKDDNDSILALIRASEEYPNPGSSYWNYLFGMYLQEYCTTPRYDNEIHAEPMDGYTLTGYNWNQIYPAVYTDKEGIEQLVITGRDWEIVSAPVNFFERNLKENRYDQFLEKDYFDLYSASHTLVHSRIDDDHRKIRSYYARAEDFNVDYVFASLLSDHDRALHVAQKTGSVQFDEILSSLSYESEDQLGTVSKEAQISVVNDAIEDVVIDTNGDLFLLTHKLQARHYWLYRLGTTLSEQVARALLTGGVDGLLNIEKQKELVENPSPINKTGNYIDDSKLEDAIEKGSPDFNGSLGVYYREIFFQIPFLIANHLNSQQKFAAAQKWYHYIFDPTAYEEIDISGLGPRPNPEEADKMLRDRNWRYIEFRNIEFEKLRDLLTDSDTIEAYRKDPFNPHAIARLRLTAYQKTIVMKYIDNLLDWGDQLFARDTMESINEATLLYILASDILGPQPVELGECDEIPAGSRTYESIKPLLNEESPFLIELESISGSNHAGNYGSADYDYTIDTAAASHASANAYMSTIGAESDAYSMATAIDDDAVTGVKKSNIADNSAMTVSMKRAAKHGAGHSVTDWQHANQLSEENQHGLWRELVSQTTAVFCIPENKGLKQYWDRVEDRLYKIRNCMNFSGIRRQLSLFAPEIDPGLLVRAKAAGLSVEDVLNAINGNLPPYRFTYVIEKAKSYAATVQNFGAALLSALEKKDVEELALLRTVHERNIMNMTRQVKQWEIDAADESIEGLKRRREAVQYRRDYRQSLADEGLSGWEKLQSTSRHLSSSIRGSQAAIGFLGAAFHLIPQTGSPFAMKYGGKEMGDSAHSFFTAIEALAEVADNIASSAGLEAGFERRGQEWEHQAKQAEHELKELEKQIKAAEIHKDLTKRSLEIHEKRLDQLDEVYEFYGEKFSNLGLYTWLSTNLQRLYREAYNNAYSMAKLVEQTYRFERSDDSGELLGSGHWDAANAGLLAGESLSIDLQNLERMFIETNYRSLEINQSFSLSQIAPTALIQLRETGECEFEISEIFFDLFYPGHYRRRIKSARLTIPCVTGPYTNVSATLTLVGSSIRVDPQPDDEKLKPVPRSRTLSIATSSAQNDAGVFELNFRDERYMPFEGAGAISSWKLSLPKSFRQFDYQTISDVLLHVSYTAEEDGLLREQIEAQNADIEWSILRFLSENTLPRVFSLARDFSSEFHRLLHSPLGQAVSINLTEMHFPLFLQGRDIEIADAELCLRVPEGQNIAGFKVKINDTSFADFNSDELYGGLLSCDVRSAFNDLLGGHSFVIEEAGDLLSGSSLDLDKLEDVLLLFTYKISHH